MRRRLLVLVGLVLFDLAAFAAAVASLPRSNGFSYRDSLEYFVNSRTGWDAACSTFVAACLASAGVYAFLEAFGALREAPSASV